MPFNCPHPDIIEARAEALRFTRAFFSKQGFLEIDTPLLSPTGAIDPYLDSFEVTSRHHPSPLFLQTSPEYALKKVLATIQRSCFQLSKVFRDEPLSDSHAVEFTMLEWYQTHATLKDMMAATENFVRAFFTCFGKHETHFHGVQADISPPFERLSVKQAFLRHLGFNPFPLNPQDLIAHARQCGSSPGDDWPWNDTFHLLILDHIEPNLGQHRPTFLYHYPPSTAALANLSIDSDGEKVAERFELYISSLELCNAYYELTDPTEQQRRFTAEQKQREKECLPPMAIDMELVSALATMPPCSGNAIGFDRLLMLCLGAQKIDQVIISAF